MFTKYVIPLFIMTGGYFIISSMIASKEGTGFLFFLCFGVLTHFCSPGLLKKDVVHIYTRESILISNDS